MGLSFDGMGSEWVLNVYFLLSGGGAWGAGREGFP